MPPVDLSKVPSLPGCYLFRDSSGEVIYVGKAKSLRKRVLSYFRTVRDPKTAALVRKISSVGFISTRSEYEAFLLENNLIKRHLPRYNIDLKDSRRYAYIEITKEPFPRILLNRVPSENAELFGPFVSGIEREAVLEVLKTAFRFRTCRKFPRKECLRYHIGLCDAPCTGRITKEDYEKNVEMARRVLLGETGPVTRALENEMREFSARQEYERALGAKGRIMALRKLGEKQTVERSKGFDQDVISCRVLPGKCFFVVMSYSKGILLDKREFEIAQREETPFPLSEFLSRYYSENDAPSEIIVDFSERGLELPEDLAGILSEMSGHTVSISRPSSPEEMELAELARANLEAAFLSKESKILDLAKALSLEEAPRVIECFDISHLSGTSTVASMVQFREAVPNKANYRRFRIRTVEGIDDFASMQEVVSRRYSRLVSEGAALPNLVVIDGGKGQLSSAVSALRSVGAKIPIISLAKELEEIYFPGRSSPLRLDRKSPGLKLLQEIRDEAHRFAISYNRLLRKKQALPGND